MEHDTWSNRFYEPLSIDRLISSWLGEQKKKQKQKQYSGNIKFGFSRICDGYLKVTIFYRTLHGMLVT